MVASKIDFGKRGRKKAAAVNRMGAVSPAAESFCTEHGMTVIPGECPWMFLGHTAPHHVIHGWFRRLTGRYPR